MKCLKLGTKCWISAFNAQGLRGIMQLIVHRGPNDSLARFASLAKKLLTLTNPYVQPLVGSGILKT
jgi:hypothetical protein